MRTVVDIPDPERAWLVKKAKEQNISMAEALRRFLRRAMDSELKRAEFKVLLEAVAGTWTQGDGLAWQRKLRNEWKRSNLL
jgi:hypothetical protein